MQEQKRSKKIFIELRDRLSKPKIKKVRKDHLYRIENEKNKRD